LTLTPEVQPIIVQSYWRLVKLAIAKMVPATTNVIAIAAHHG
jgi:hypothetical protein